MGPQRVGPFPDDVREEIYRHYISVIRSRDADIPLTLSTESMSMWQRLGKELGVTPANYVLRMRGGSNARKDASRLEPVARRAHRPDVARSGCALGATVSGSPREFPSRPREAAP